MPCDTTHSPFVFLCLFFYACVFGCMCVYMLLACVGAPAHGPWPFVCMVALQKQKRETHTCVGTEARTHNYFARNLVRNENDAWCFEVRAKQQPQQEGTLVPVEHAVRQAALSGLELNVSGFIYQSFPHGMGSAELVEVEFGEGKQHVCSSGRPGNGRLNLTQSSTSITCGRVPCAHLCCAYGMCCVSLLVHVTPAEAACLLLGLFITSARFTSLLLVLTHAN